MKNISYSVYSCIIAGLIGILNTLVEKGEKVQHLKWQKLNTIISYTWYKEHCSKTQTSIAEQANYFLLLKVYFWAQKYID